MKTNDLRQVNGESAAAIVTWKPDEHGSYAEAIRSVGHALAEYQAIPTNTARASRDRFANIETNITVRNEFRRGDYEYFRPSEAVPAKQKEAIAFCMEAYRKIGLIRNIIDLMADFGSQGVNIHHPNKRIEKFGQKWFRKVNGPERSERFLHLLYRAGNVVVKRSMAKLTLKEEKKWRASAEDKIGPDMKMPNTPEPKTRVIPIQYNFLNPLTIEVVGNEIAQFAGKHIYMMSVSRRLQQIIKFPKDAWEKAIVESLPNDLVTRIKNGDKFIPLDNTKISVFHYKKDDWQVWADPMTYAILDDLILLEKMKLADLAALDGAISQIRVWKLGSLETNPPIMPTKAAVSKLADILMSNPGGGAFDLIWDCCLSVDEYKTNVHNFLGDTKYAPVMNSIYAGLGIPPTLTGGSGDKGFTNNFISLKTLVQRLEYGRRMLEQFWRSELETLRIAMGFKHPFTIRFDRMILNDEAAEKALLIQLWDRNLISDDTIRERIGEDAELEVLRMQKEEKDREKKKRQPKASPYHVADKNFELAKIALQRTLLSPKQAGFEIDEEDYKEPPFLMQMKSAEKLKAAAPTGGATSPKSGNPKGRQGRPKGAKDNAQRTRKPKPLGMSRSTEDFISTITWANLAQNSIAEVVNPLYLAHIEKKNLRQLSAEETEELESLKFSILLKLKAYSDINCTVIKEAMNTYSIPKQARLLFNSLAKSVYEKAGRSPTVDEARNIRSAVYSIINEEINYNE